MGKNYQLAIFLSFVTTISGPVCADEAAARKMIDDYANAYNKHDLDTVAGYWTENSVHIDHETGQRTEGREAVRADIAASFKESPASRLFGRVRHLHLIKPDVARVEGEATVSSPGLEPSQVTFSAVLVNQDNKWMIDSIEETPVAVPASSYDALQDLEWLIGHWVDKSDEARVDTVFS